MISASARAMKQFSLPGKESQAVGVGAVETLCPAHDPLPGHPATTSESTSTAAPISNYEGPPSPGPVQSKVINVTLPAGTTTVGVDAGTIPGIEIWHVPLDIPAAVESIGSQVPSGPYEGLPACPVDATHPKDGSPGITTWAWENSAGDYVTISVGAFRPPGVTTPGPGAEVMISRGRETTPEPC
jgi:hypothetical protein